MLPDFICIGARKSATSSLCKMLGEHPGVYMALPKEPCFFSTESNYTKGFEWYESLFDEAQPGQIVGEGSTEYSEHKQWPDAPKRLASLLPNAKILFMARNPLDRIVSHWIHLHTSGGEEPRPIEEAVADDPQYLDFSLYDYQLSFYRDLFPEERIRVTFFEDFVKDPRGTTNQVLEFLGIDEPLPEAADDSARNSWRKRRRDSSLLRAFRGAPGLAALRRRSPVWLRQMAVKLLKKPLEGKPTMDEATRSFVLDHVGDDSRAFLERYGKPADFWNL